MNFTGYSLAPSGWPVSHVLSQNTPGHKAPNSIDEGISKCTHHSENCVRPAASLVHVSATNVPVLWKKEWTKRRKNTTDLQNYEWAVQSIISSHNRPDAINNTQQAMEWAPVQEYLSRWLAITRFIQSMQQNLVTYSTTDKHGAGPIFSKPRLACSQ